MRKLLLAATCVLASLAMVPRVFSQEPEQPIFEQEPEQPSLGDVARQNRDRKKAAPEHVLTDQTSEPALPVETSICGDPLPVMQKTYASALVGVAPPSDDELGKDLLEWLDQHPGLDAIDPDELAKSEEPKSAKQYWANHDLAENIASMFVEEMKSFRENHTDAEVGERVAKMLEAKLPTRQGDVLQRAVRDEKQRREALQGKTPTESDRLSEAINLYSICENKRLISSQGEVEKQSKIALRTKLEQAGFKLPEETTPPAKTDGE